MRAGAATRRVRGRRTAQPTPSTQKPPTAVIRVPDDVRFFDTTLRDGEQAPGIALTAAEKLEVAEQLARLGVDVIEAGFPASSPGEFEAVRRIAGTVKGTVVAALCRANDGDIDRAWEA